MLNEVTWHLASIINNYQSITICFFILRTTFWLFGNHFWCFDTIMTTIMKICFLATRCQHIYAQYLSYPSTSASCNENIGKHVFDLMIWQLSGSNCCRAVKFKLIFALNRIYSYQITSFIYEYKDVPSIMQIELNKYSMTLILQFSILR